MKKILIVVGTRPNFIKITQFPIIAKKYAGRLEFKILHTGQHFDRNMSTVFFQQFGFEPDIYLNIEPGTPISQMAHIMLGLEKVVNEYQPDLIIVPGDVNSTFAAALTANKMQVKVAHLESGLRSFDRTMPEEFNRILTDDVADMFFVTEQSGNDHLINEGKLKENIHFVGNTMIDTMVAFDEQIDQSDIMKKLGVGSGEYTLMTMHRPATVDSEEGLRKLVQLISEVSKKYKIIFPIHPRTRKKLKSFGMMGEVEGNPQVILSEPMDYFAFQQLIKSAKFILTDSGGIQEESTFRQVPCLTLRPNTERPVTVTLGSNELIPFDVDIIKEKIAAIENGDYKKGEIPPMWDGKATERIVEVIARKLL